MKKLFPLLFLMFAFTASGQSLQDKINTFEQKNAYKIDYDKSSDRTIVTIGEAVVRRAEESKSPVNAISMGATFSFSGEDLKDNVGEYRLYLQSSCPRWCFLENHSLILLTDSEKIDLGNGEFNARVGYGHGEGVTETMVYTLRPSDLAAIANSQTSRLKLGNFVFVLNEDHKRMLKNAVELGTIAK
ncbi:MAG: hypothetical protein JWN60_1702 [Acidobacteria bacterium]|jgi:hypothetical protein|nr:hypothetical protein [Acidobacteriota bacterium]